MLREKKILHYNYTYWYCYRFTFTTIDTLTSASSLFPQLSESSSHSLPLGDEWEEWLESFPLWSWLETSESSSLICLQRGRLLHNSGNCVRTLQDMSTANKPACDFDVSESFSTLVSSCAWKRLLPNHYFGLFFHLIFDLKDLILHHFA